MHFLDFLLKKNSLIRFGPSNIPGIAKVILSTLNARIQERDENFDANIPDLLHHFIETKKTHPDLVNNDTLVNT